MLESLLEAQVGLTEAQMRVSDAERILKRSYMDKSEALTDLLDKAVNLPLYGGYAGTGVPVDVLNYPPLVEYVREAGDVQYLALPFEAWSVILTGVYDAVEDALGRWDADINDCDNFALSFHSFVARVFRDSGFPLQGAFGWARSWTHGFNVFVSMDDGCWVFEPQSGTVKGRLGETGSPYDTIRLYFLS